MSKVRVRDRQRSEFPALVEPGFIFDANSARWDKVEISMDVAGCGSSSSKEIHALFQRVGSAGNGLRSAGRPHMPRLVASTRGNDRLYDVSLRHIGANEFRASKLRADFTINPTRHYALYPGITPIDMARGRLLLLQNPEASLRLKSLSLDESDNWIMPNDLTLFEGMNWDEYLTSILKYAADDLMRKIMLHVRTEEISQYPDRLRSWSVRATELYCEYRHQWARQAVDDFYHSNKNFFTKDKDTLHASEEGSPDGNSFTFATKRSGLELAAYAKTESRVRFELRLKKYPRQIFPRELSRADYPDSGLHELPRFLRGVRECCGVVAEKICAGLSAIPQNYAVPEGRIKLLYDFMHTGEVSRQQRLYIASALASSGRISAGYDPQMAATLEKMHASGLLISYRKKPNRPRAYGAVPELQRLLGSIVTRGPTA